jgi:hypothetical protein
VHNLASNRSSNLLLTALRRGSLIAVTVVLWCANTAAARPIEEHAPSPPTHKAPAKTPAKTPSKPAEPTPKPTTPPTSKTTEESSSASPPSRGEPLGSNGGSSPLCSNPAVLSPPAQRNCETSNFIGASAPTGNYAFDVNIDTGIANLSNDISATIENFLQFGWMGLVALVHGLIVMYEWCYSLNLVSSLMSEITRGLHSTQLTFTQPLMMVALTIASVLAVYNGLFRRRVADTVGQVMMMLAMMIGGLWVILNPAGSIGAAGQLANEASLGTLSAVTTGSPNNSYRNLSEAMRKVFNGVITVPWCYMEFGDVAWCRDPAQIDGELQKAGQKIAETEQKESKCSGLCGAGASPHDRGLATSAFLLKNARTNGELFLALPANEVDRNSVKTEGSLLAVLCGSEEAADECNTSTQTAPQAEFRTERGTGSRVIGLILIWLGALGMLLLLGFLVFRLLEAAIAALLYLLLAPAAVLAPALGDGGRAAFRGWATRLLGAVISKLVYSFLLGVVLMMMNLLLGLKGLGWWAQWLLISALWWVALHHRHKVLSFAHGSNGDFETRSMRWFYRVRMAQDLGRIAGWARHKLSPPPPATPRSPRTPGGGGGRKGPHKPPGGSGGSGTGAPGGGSGGGTGKGTGKKGAGSSGSARTEPKRERKKREGSETGGGKASEKKDDDATGRPPNGAEELPDRESATANVKPPTRDSENSEGKGEGADRQTASALPDLGDLEERSRAADRAAKETKARKPRKGSSTTDKATRTEKPEPSPPPTPASPARRSGTRKPPTAAGSAANVARPESPPSAERVSGEDHKAPSTPARATRTRTPSPQSQEPTLDQAELSRALARYRAGREAGHRKPRGSGDRAQNLARQFKEGSGRSVGRPPAGKK